MSALLQPHPRACSLAPAQPRHVTRLSRSPAAAAWPCALCQAVKATHNVFLMNPDMLHSSLLPNHKRWARELAALRFIVLDEAHSYSGLFGCHVALLLRRLLRVCAHHGGHPQLICCSATIANPRQHFEQLVSPLWLAECAARGGPGVTLVDQDGSARGTRTVVVWNTHAAADAAAATAGAGGGRGGGGEGDGDGGGGGGGRAGVVRDAAETVPCSRVSAVVGRVAEAASCCCFVQALAGTLLPHGLHTEHEGCGAGHEACCVLCSLLTAGC